MRWLKSKLTLSCKRASELIDKKQEGKISWLQSVQLRIHTSMCGFCTSYEKQSSLLQKMLENRFSNTDKSKTASNLELKQKIMEKLKAAEE